MNNQYLFNVKYYDGLYDKLCNASVEEANDSLLKYEFINKTSVPDLASIPERSFFRMKTVYPGLLIGTGNPHSSGASADEIKLGFTLDYVAGLPYIPGSTVKGVLRSVFKRPNKRKGESEAGFITRKEAYCNRIEYVKDLIGEICDGQKPSDDELAKLEEEIFGDNKNGKGDLFFDAFLVRGGDGNRIFAFESITPHQDPLKDPIPIRLLKVIPNVIFEFNFSLKDSKCFTPMTAEKKNELFIALISDFGLGAKTNVGFGVMEEYKGELEPLTSTEKKNGKCAKCGGKTIQKPNGDFYHLCPECKKEAPKCKQCNSKTVTWNSNANAWYELCWDCSKSR